MDIAFNDWPYFISSYLCSNSVCVCIKGQFKDEFVTAGGVPLSEVPSLPLYMCVHVVGGVFHVCICFCVSACVNVSSACSPPHLISSMVQVSLNTMQSRIQSNLFFAGEVFTCIFIYFVQYRSNSWPCN